jgi:hypothetical protein
VGTHPAQVKDRFLQSQDGPTAAQSSEQGLKNIQSFVAHRKYFARFLNLGRHSFALEESNRFLHTQTGQRRVEKPTRPAKGLHDAPVVGRVRQIAARTPRHQDLDTRLAVFLQEQRSPAGLGCTNRRHQSAGAGSNNYHIPETLGHRLSGRLIEGMRLASTIVFR